ncbi:MAG: malonic semialdehyde reductase [Candidatus Nanopelagicales bacterium]
MSHEFDTTLLGIDAASAAALFHEARTAYSFTDQPVTDAQLAAIVHLLRWAPTAINSGPLRVSFARTPEAKARLLPLASSGNQQKITEAPVTAILAADTDFHEHIELLAPGAIGMKAGFDDSFENRNGFARFNASIQTGYFILAVRALGLAAGPMAGFNNAGVDEEFFPNSPLRSILLVNIGYPSAEAFRERSARLPLETVVEYL